MKIEFIGLENISSLIDTPEPAKNFVPSWYSDTPRFLNSPSPIIKNNEVINNSIKSCLPFYDAMTNGYIQKTWCDIYINFDDAIGLEYQYSRGPEIMKHRDMASIKNNDFYPIEFIWQNFWMPKLPHGWSVLICHPLNRIDLPFYTASGIIDSDVFYHNSPPGNLPFYIKKDFNGIIPAGTPMYQILPIKRENWKSEKRLLNEKEIFSRQLKLKTHFIGSYKRIFHKKKSFK